MQKDQKFSIFKKIEKIKAHDLSFCKFFDDAILMLYHIKT